MRDENVTPRLEDDTVPLCEQITNEPLISSSNLAGGGGSSISQKKKSVPHPFLVRPKSLRTVVAIPQENTEISSNYVSFANVLYSILVGWWLSLFIFIAGFLMFITGFGYKLGIRIFQLAKFVFYPFGYYAYLDKSNKPNIFTRIIFYLIASIFIVIPIFCGMLITWELIFYIPMAKFLMKLIPIIFKNMHKLKIGKLHHHNPENGHLPVALTYKSGSFLYFKYNVLNFEVIYLNLYPFVILSFYLGFFAKEDSPFREPVTGTLISIIGTIPCMYIIGVCTEIISGRCGLVLGSLINAGFTGLVELILFYFSIRQELGDVVRAAVTGAFLMNLLVIPGLSMLAAGIKWKEVKLNRKVQSVSGTFLFLAIVAVFFPAIFYGIYSHSTIVCNYCFGKEGTFYVSNRENINCSHCSIKNLDNIDNDNIYTSMARPLMYTVSCVMPIVYGVGLFFSLKTHKYIYDQFEAEQAGEESTGAQLKTWMCIIILLVSCVGFSIICEILTDMMPEAIGKMGLTERFVGLVFYTLVPAVAEFMNAIRFALEGNMGLSLEIGNQGAMVVSLIQMPALVLMSLLIGSSSSKGSFTLMFEMIDVFAVIISVLLRNSMFMENSINYFTGFAFLVIFLIIAIVYYFDPY
ncbi:Sodium/calcium exchanger protein [Tritrichomonas foetus]|uniref:Sodium/calcium exchanger protein n=1 Tax=Tritrichomonas foetus TaxID=1144522 RepID=A0A1J4K9G9_9EUKA|nr:Sodium/calcium exchanger protein [Tritrichomonas foetus]|eukprot:OHT07875.1 Sodium/calcium exchanger protein [Tritrichomonas foetus]